MKYDDDNAATNQDCILENLIERMATKMIIVEPQAHMRGYKVPGIHIQIQEF